MYSKVMAQRVSFFLGHHVGAKERRGLCVINRVALTDLVKKHFLTHYDDMSLY